MHEQLQQIVHMFTNALEWRCLDQIRAPIQELRVAELPDRPSAARGGNAALASRTHSEGNPGRHCCATARLPSRT
jgi:hypothetical protein